MKKIFFLLTFALSLHVGALQGQRTFPFELKPRMDIAALAGGFVLSGLGYRASEDIVPFKEADILLLDKSGILPNWDRKATMFWSKPVRQASDIGLGLSGTGALSLTIFQKRQQREWLTLSLMGAETFLWTYGLTALAKGHRKRSRPFLYNPAVPLGQKLDKDARQSFFSGHSSMAAASCVFASEVFIATHPDSKWSPWVRAGSFVLPATVGYLRYRTGKHFPTDVLTGLAVGSMIGWVVPRLHRKAAIPGMGHLRVFPSANGLVLILNANN